MMDRNAECLTREAWRQWHTELLQSTVNRVYARVPFYRKAMDLFGVGPDDISTLEDLARLPFTTRNDLSNSYPYGFFAVPLRDIVRIQAHRSVQTNPVVIGHTRSDLEHRQGLTARFLRSCGVTQDDIAQICLDPGMSVLGQELKDGAEIIGALVIPPDPLSTRARLKVMVDFKTTVLMTSPSYGRHLLHELTYASIPIASLSLKTAILVGEHLGEDLRKELEDGLSIKVHASYGISEAAGPAMAYECGKGVGLHLAMDHFIPEIISPETGKQLPYGEYGELVVTTFATKANPLVRFRTGDMTRLVTDPCPCGRTTWRIDSVRERCDDIVSIRGVKISPIQIESFLASRCGGSAPPHLVVIREERFLKQVELLIAMDEGLFTGNLPDMHTWLRSLESAFEEEIGIACRALPVERGRLSPFLDAGEKIVTL